MKFLALFVSCLFLGAAVVHAADAPPQPPAGAVNLLAGADADAEATDQEQGQWKTEWGNWSYDTAIRHGGKQSFGLSNWVQLYSTKLIKVMPGYRYYLAGYTRIENFKFLKEGHYGVGFGLEQFRADGSRNGNWYDMYTYGIYKEGDNDWIYSVGSWIPKDTTVYLKPAILVKASEGSKAWVDDLFMWAEPLPEKSTAAPANIIENASFEIIYNVDTTPFGFWLLDPAGTRVEFGDRAVATKDKAALQASSVVFHKPATLRSPVGKLEGKTLDAAVKIRPEKLNGGNVKVRMRFLDADGKFLEAVDVGECKADADDWIEVAGSIDLTRLPAAAALAQMEIELAGAEDMLCYVDDLKAMVMRPIKGLPIRPYDSAKATITLDTAATGGIFTSPLNAYDHHCADRVYSYSIGTAGPHLEGEGRWYEMQGKLGIKYVRVHSGFDSNGLCEHLAVSETPGGADYFKAMSWQNGEEGVTFSGTRINPETGKPFPPVVRIDDKGEMITDFSSIQYYLDHGIRRGGALPIFDLAPVPMALANDNDVHQPPRDMKQWEEFVERFFRFLVDTYGEEEILKWKFETGNEPGTEPTFHGRNNRANLLDDFLEMQDHTIAAAQRVLPGVFIAGPSGPPGNFFLPMLKHAATGTNYATGKVGTKLDAISYHGYMGGTPVDLSWRFSEEQVFSMMRYRDYFRELTGKNLEVWNTEFAPIYLEVTPKNPPNSAYDNHIQAVATLHMTNFSSQAGVTLLAFFYHSPIYMAPVRGDHDFKKSPNQATTPEFVGEPTVRTFHGVIKPVARIFQLLSWLNGGQKLTPEVSNEPIFALAVRDGNTVKLIAYNYDVNPTLKYTTDVTVRLEHLEPSRTYTVTRYELNSTKANSWYLSTRDQVTQKMCEDDIGVVDRLNRESEFVPDTIQCASDAEGRMVLTLPMEAMSASLLVFTPEAVPQP